MRSRREILTLSAAAAAAIPLASCSDARMHNYDAAAAKLRAKLSETPDLTALIRFATLAANGHNTQPWRFTVRADGGISISPDLTRRTLAVDPDDHHLYVSLGCAAENLIIAGAAHGRPGAVTFDSKDNGRIDIDLARAPPQSDALATAIPLRQSTRSMYDGRTAAFEDLKRLEKAAALDGVSITLFTDKARRDAVRDFVVDGNSAQMDDPAFVAELRDWIRFNADDALRSGDGLFTACSGSPTMPAWIGKPMFNWFFRKEAETDKYTKHIASSAGIAVFTGDKADRAHWVQVGRSFQRFALQATALGIRHAHINQPVEIASVRTEFAAWLGAKDQRPDLVIRFGYAPPLPMSMRRPLASLIEVED